ncbi:TetR/AcrR family transcriptional regulator [Gloeocapsopsis dulcis]|uniref:TetR family transcriptional regulator n=1 Tax=Gloeocapsopsis dulcis AAB1 = 1H9 TaxID=1433147 RepID=A0A6N8FZV8_9CHRO|nr:TetR/AcrR family transcriptional regulator [Gloeocapsopsis dulcis]MUL38399.1 TetR family transcriptional regulator [Gloeocapsopsis dulcis AAB1 = 1H9]WNN89185.1 TetR/AcrR family transcriptional regulator [Gloeocapsopsis dulcis]
MTNSSPRNTSDPALNYLNEVGVELVNHLESEPVGSSHSKREQILQGAMQVFLKQGYAKTSMDRVATAAGVSKQTIYSHFQDKEGLFIALIERVTIRSFLCEFQNPFQGEPEIVLRRIAERFLAKMDDQEYIAFFRLVIAESARFPELAQLYTRTVVQFGFRNLSNYFAARPELNIADTEATARIFLGSLVAFVLAQEVLHGKHTMPMEKERLISSLINCVLG